MELTLQQKTIINAPEDKVLVLASAGTSKTTVLIERVNYYLNNGAKPEDIVAITFTTQAAGEMLERLGTKAQGMFCSTVHAYANYLLLTNGIDTRDYLDKEEYDELFKLIKANPQCVHPVKYLLLDEGQDSDEQQFEFMFNALAPEHFFVCADVKQCIYQWKGSRPELVCGLSGNYGAKIYELTENFRNSRDILNFAKWIVKEKMNEVGQIPYSDNSIGLVQDKGIKTSFEFDLKEIARMVSHDEIYNDWFILARSNKRVDEIYNYLKKYDVPVDTFKKSELTNRDLHERMQANTVKVLTIHSAKGLEANKVIVVDAVMSREEECRIAYVAATRARKELYWAKRARKKKMQNWE